MANERRCPRCEETADAAAQVCEHCGYILRNDPHGESEPGTAAAGNDRAKSTRGQMMIAGVAMAVAVLGTLAAWVEETQASEEDVAVNSGPPIQVTAEDLALAYANDAAAAEQRYGRRPLEVTGTATSLALSFSDTPFLVLQGTNHVLGPEAKLTDTGQAKAASLIKGSKVRLHCRSVSQPLDIPMLAHCDIL